MGIRGLTTYIAKYSDRYLEPHELKSCTLIIDGNNIACQLYNWVSKCNCAFGGDYDKYANCVKNFFTLLLKCEVVPLVIFDGGYETKKLPTVRERLKKKLLTARSSNPMTQSNFQVFPLFMKEVFMDVLRNLNISFVQSDFEADSEIAVIARQLGCPVLSYDSDFYIYDVLYIPFSSVILEPVKYVNSDKNVKYYISCKIYRIETFLNSLGGLDKSLLPVLAVVLGNDYIEKHVLQNFLAQVKCPKHRSLNSTQRQIVGILGWLRNETLNTAIAKILSRLKKDKRASVSRQLKDIITGYKNNTSNLLPYICKSESEASETAVDTSSIEVSSNQKSNTNKECKVGGEKEKIKTEGREEEAGKEVGGCEEEQSESSPNMISSCITSDIENSLPADVLPKWFIESFRQGDLPACFINMVVLKTHFFTPQVEKFSLCFSHNVSLPILRVIFSLLISEFSEKNNLQLNCVMYVNTSLKNLALLPAVSMIPLPLLQSVPSSPLHIRESIIYDVAEFITDDVQTLNAFPNNWKIIIISLVYWARKVSDPFVTLYHIHALLFSIVVLNIVDSHTGYCRSKKGFLKEHGNELKKVDMQKKTQQELNYSNSITDALAAVLKNDCLSVFDNILHFHKMDESLKNRPKLFSLEVVHIFAQFQSCAYFFYHLNALLNFPFPRCQIANFYSGTVVYNSCMNFKKRSNVEDYICKHILNVPSLEMLYKALIKTILCFLPNLCKTDEKKPNHKRKKKKKHSENDSTSGNEQNSSEESETSEIEEFMKNNRFSTLSLAS